MGVCRLPGPLAIHRGVHLLVRHNLGHPSGQRPLQLLITDSGQGPGDGSGVGKTLPDKPQGILESCQGRSGEEGYMGHRGLPAYQAQKGQPEYDLNGMRDSFGPPGILPLAPDNRSEIPPPPSPNTPHLTSPSLIDLSLRLSNRHDLLDKCWTNYQRCAILDPTQQGFQIRNLALQHLSLPIRRI